jgi:hypothetical protein
MGFRWSEVQILSPRPIKSSTCEHHRGGLEAPSSVLSLLFVPLADFDSRSRLRGRSRPRLASPNPDLRDAPAPPPGRGRAPLPASTVVVASVQGDPVHAGGRADPGPRASRSPLRRRWSANRRSPQGVIDGAFRRRAWPGCRPRPSSPMHLHVAVPGLTGAAQEDQRKVRVQRRGRPRARVSPPGARCAGLAFHRSASSKSSSGTSASFCHLLDWSRLMPMSDRVGAGVVSHDTCLC